MGCAVSPTLLLILQTVQYETIKQQLEVHRFFKNNNNTSRAVCLKSEGSYFHCVTLILFLFRGKRCQHTR